MAWEYAVNCILDSIEIKKFLNLVFIGPILIIFFNVTDSFVCAIFPGYNILHYVVNCGAN